jgi:restriction system protein
LGKEGVIPANAEDDTDEAQDFAPDIEDIANQQIVSLIKSEFAGTALGGCCNALAWP